MTKIFLPLLAKLRIIEVLLLLKDYKNIYKIANELNKALSDKSRRSKNYEIFDTCKINLAKSLKEIEKQNFGYALNLIQDIISTIDNFNSEIKCSEKWYDLTWTDNHDVKFCDLCRKHVYRANTSIEILKRIKLGQCVAVDSDNSDENVQIIIKKIKSNICILEIPYQEPLM